jgi:hypothetical protein
MKRNTNILLFFILSCGFFIQVKAQKLVLQNTKNIDINFKLKPGKVIWVQTFDDALDYTTKCYFVTYDGLHLIVKIDPSENTYLRIPIDHISHLYFNKFQFRYFSKQLFFLYGWINLSYVFAGGMNLYGLSVVSGGMGLITLVKIVDNIGSKKVVYVPHYSLSLTPQK